MEGVSSEYMSSRRSTAMNEFEVEERDTKESLRVDELVDQTESSSTKERNEVEKEGPRYLPSLLDWMEDNGSVTSDPIAENRSVSSVADTVTSESSSWGPFQYADDADDADDADSGHIPPQTTSHEQLLLEDDEDSSEEDEDLFLISSGSGTDTDSEAASRRESIGKPPLHPLKPRIQSPSLTSKFEVVDKSSYDESGFEEDGEEDEDEDRNEEEDEDDEQVAEDSDHDSAESNAESEEISDDRSEDSTLTDRYLGVYEINEVSSDPKTVFRAQTNDDNEKTIHTTNERLYKPVEERDSLNYTNRIDEERFVEDEQEEEREGWDQAREEVEDLYQQDVYDVNQQKNVSEHLASAIRPNNDPADVDETSCLEFTYSDEDFEEKCSRQEAATESPRTIDLHNSDPNRSQNDVNNRSVQDPQSDHSRTEEGGLDTNDSRYSDMILTPSTARLVSGHNENNHSSLIELTYSDENFEGTSLSSAEKMPTYGANSESGVLQEATHITERNKVDILESHYPSPQPAVQEVQEHHMSIDADSHTDDSRYSCAPLTPSTARLINDQNENNQSSLIELTYSNEDFEGTNHSSTRKVPSNGASSESGVLEQATYTTERNKVDILESHYPSPRLGVQEVQEQSGGELDHADSRYSGAPLTPSSARLINDQNENNQSSLIELAYSDEDFEGTNHSSTRKVPSNGASSESGVLEQATYTTERNKVDILESHYPSPRLGVQEAQEQSGGELDHADSRYSGAPLTPSSARLINDQNENNQSSLIELAYSDEDFECTSHFSAKKLPSYGDKDASDILEQAIRMSDIRTSERNEIDKLEAPAPLLTDSDIRLLSKQAADRSTPGLKFTFSDENSEKSSPQEDHINLLKANVDHAKHGTGSMDSSGDGMALQETEIQHKESTVVDEVPLKLGDETVEKEHLERFLLRMKETARKALHESSLGKKYNEDDLGFDFNDVQQWIREKDESGTPQNDLRAHQERDSSDPLVDSSPNAEQMNASSTPDLVQDCSCHDASSDVDDSCTDEISFDRLNPAVDAQHNGAFPDFGLNDIHSGKKAREAEASNIEGENEIVAQDSGLDDINHGESSDSVEGTNCKLELKGDCLSISSEKTPDLGLDEIHHGVSPESRKRGKANKNTKVRDEHLSISSASQDVPEKAATGQSNATFFCNDERAALKKEDSFDLLTAYLESMRNDPDKATEISAVFANLVDKTKAKDPPDAANLVIKPRAQDPPGIRLGPIPESSPTSMESKKDSDEEIYSDNKEEPPPLTFKLGKQGGGEDRRDDDVTEASFPILTPKTKKFGNQFPEEILVKPAIQEASNDEGLTSTFDSNSAAPDGIQIDFSAHFLPTGNSPNQNDMNTSNLSPDMDRQGSIIESLVSESPFLNENDLYGHNQKGGSSSESPDSDSLLLKEKEIKTSDSVSVQGDASVKTGSGGSPLLQKSSGGKVEVESFGERSAVRTLYARTGYATVTGIPSKWIVEAAEHEQQYPYPHPLQGETLEANNRLQKSANSKHSSKQGVFKKVLHRMHGKKKISKKPSYQNDARLIL